MTVPSSAKDRDELMKRLAALVPFAKGSVCVSHKPCGNPWKCKKCLSGEMHPSVQYSFRENGKLRTMHVQPRFLKQVQEAIAKAARSRGFSSRLGRSRRKADGERSGGGKGRRRPLSERRADEAQTRMTESPRLHRPYP